MCMEKNLIITMNKLNIEIYCKVIGIVFQILFFVLRYIKFGLM
jgi:hypothetical protein